MNDWHVDAQTLDAYVRRSLEPLAMASVDAHLDRCAACRALCAPTQVPGPGEEIWARIADRIEAPAQGRIGEWLLRLGVREADVTVSRMVATECAQWVLAATVVFAAVAATVVFGRGTWSSQVFVLVAPLVTPVCVALVYRYAPTGLAGIERAAPYRPARLLLWRTAYVQLVTAPAAVFCALILPDGSTFVVAWLLPTVACTLAVVAASTFLDPELPAVVVAVTWGMLVLIRFRIDPADIGTVAVQLACAATAVVAGAVVWARSPRNTAISGTGG